VTRSSPVRVTARLLLGLLAATPAAAQEGPRAGPINVDVIVTRVTQRSEAPERATREVPGLASPLDASERRGREIDKRVRAIDAKLRGRMRYDRMEFVERHRMVLAGDEVGTVRLPNGHRFRAQLLDVDARGALLAVDVENSVKMDVRAPSGHPVIIGAEAYEDGYLVISVEPRF